MLLFGRKKHIINIDLKETYTFQLRLAYYLLGDKILYQKNKIFKDF